MIPQFSVQGFMKRRHLRDQCCIVCKFVNVVVSHLCPLFVYYHISTPKEPNFDQNRAIFQEHAALAFRKQGTLEHVESQKRRLSRFFFESYQTYIPHSLVSSAVEYLILYSDCQIFVLNPLYADQQVRKITALHFDSSDRSRSSNLLNLT